MAKRSVLVTVEASDAIEDSLENYGLDEGATAADVVKALKEASGDSIRTTLTEFDLLSEITIFVQVEASDGTKTFESWTDH